jgi:hypothetical protein
MLDDLVAVYLLILSHLVKLWYTQSYCQMRVDANADALTFEVVCQMIQLTGPMKSHRFNTAGIPRPGKAGVSLGVFIFATTRVSARLSPNIQCVQEPC